MRKPARYTRRPCPECGGQRQVVNGMWLRWQRERAGVCLREAARRLGTSAAYLSDVERGARNVTQRVEEFYVERFAA